MMKTEKLYYESAYIKEFEATVISCRKRGEDYIAVLDKTAFFPEEAGQHADSGEIDGIPVIAVEEHEGVIYHLMKAPLAEGKVCRAQIDFEARFDKMQQHTAEHLASGIIHSLYGAENVGFHLGPDEVTFDTSLPLTREMLDEVEKIANRAIYENRRVTQSFPTSDELSGFTYRAKLELTEDVRIVEIDGYDACACCAPHVATLGEIGVIKFVYSEKHKGGTRVYLLAGNRAYKYFSELFFAASKISNSLSVPTLDIAEEVEKLKCAKAQSDARLAECALAMAKLYAQSLGVTSGCAVVHLPLLDAAYLREYANLASEKVGEILVALCGTEGEYKYVIKSRTLPVESFIKEANEALCGRGGGRGAMAQGSFSASLADIERYFKKLG